MDEIGAEILAELGQDVLYTPPGDASVPVSVRAVVRDRGARARVGRRIVLTSDVVAAVSDGLSFARNGTLTVGDTVYRIDEKQVGAPGLTELGLSRLTGGRIERHDGISDDIIAEFGKPIVIAGATVMAHIVRSASVLEQDRDGMFVEVIRTVATVRVADAPNIRPRDEVVIGGRVYTIRSTDRDGFGLVSLILD